MNKSETNTLQLISIQHELSMAIGKDLLLLPMLDHFINTAIRRLGLSSAHIYFLKSFLESEDIVPPDPVHLKSYINIPSSTNLDENLEIKEILQYKKNTTPNYYAELHNPDSYLYFFSLPEIGLIILKRRQIKLDQTILQMLKPVFKRLSDSCQASVKHESLIETLEKELKLEAKNRELNEALFHSQKNESIAAMVNGVAHDFNNILAGINGFKELLAKTLHGEEFEKPLSHLKRIGECCSKGQDLIQSMLDFAKGKELDKEEINLNDETEKISQLIKMSLKPTVDLQFKPSKKSCYINASRTHYYQLILNLCKNASDAIAKTGTITIEIEEDALQANCNACNNFSVQNSLAIKISDNGSGIKPENITSIFKPFFSTKSKSDGSGIGLSVVNRITHLNGGHITCESKLGQGTTFSIYLPPIQKTIKEQNIATNLLNIAGMQIHILSNDTQANHALSSFLQALDAKPKTFTSPLYFLSKWVQNTPPDAVIISNDIPELKATELIDIIKLKNKKTPFLLIADQDSSINNENCNAFNIDAVFSKQIDYKAICQCLSNINMKTV